MDEREVNELVEALLGLSVDAIEDMLREPALTPKQREFFLDLWRQKMAIRTRARNAVPLLRDEFRRAWGREPTPDELLRRVWAAEAPSRIVVLLPGGEDTDG
jgi:hypothetical protein